MWIITGFQRKVQGLSSTNRPDWPARRQDRHMQVQKVNKKSIRILILFLLVTSVVHSQTRPRESLRGLSGVYVYVHPVEKDVEAGGLSTNQDSEDCRNSAPYCWYPFTERASTREWFRKLGGHNKHGQTSSGRIHLRRRGVSSARGASDTVTRPRAFSISNVGR